MAGLVSWLGFKSSQMTDKLAFRLFGISHTDESSLLGGVGFFRVLRFFIGTHSYLPSI